MRYSVYILLLYSSILISQISLVKGPYLQIGTPSSIIVKWQTNTPTNTKVSYGTSPTLLNFSYFNTMLDTIHEAHLGGLSAYTKYYYSIGNSTLVIQGDTNNYFITSPTQGTAGKYRFWITGDCGNGSVNQVDVKNKYLQYNGNRPTNGWLLLGDNAYWNGLDPEYNTNFFNIYQTDIMKKSVLWPSPGNHDYANSLSNQNSHNIPYYSIFNLPSGAEAGGVWSGTEAFYSFNYGNIHFVSLDSYGHELNQYRLYDTLGPQITWLKQDLVANSLPWTVVYFHHPPYTMASHNSDTEGELDSVRKNTVRILERFGVDFVLCGHSHGYERSKLMSGHFGYESSFNATQHHLSSSSALYNGSANSCPYTKSLQNKGTVYVVSGSAGSLGGQQASYPHDAMYYSNVVDGGSLILDIENNRADLKFLCADGIVRDKFTVFKTVNNVTTYSITSGQSTTLTASWPGNYIWSNSSDTMRAHAVTAYSDTMFWVKDKFNCVADTFYIKVFAGIHELSSERAPFVLFPNPGTESFIIGIELSKPSQLNFSIVTSSGKKVFSSKNKIYPVGPHQIKLLENNQYLAEGIYFITVDLNGSRFTKKLVVVK